MCNYEYLKVCEKEVWQNMKRCIIVGAGEFHEKAWKYEKADYLIAADGGFEYLRKLKIIPDMLIGDMDSIKQEYVGSEMEIKKLPREKDDTDMLAAMKEGLAAGCKEFYIYGALGGERIDHSIANIQCLLYLHKHGAKGVLYGINDRIELLCNDKVCYPATMEGILSVFAFGGDAKGVSEHGLKYSIQDAEMKMEFPIGISNEFIGQESMIEVKDGMLLLCIHAINGEKVM